METHGRPSARNCFDINVLFGFVVSALLTAASVQHSTWKQMSAWPGKKKAAQFCVLMMSCHVLSMSLFDSFCVRLLLWPFTGRDELIGGLSAHCHGQFSSHAADADVRCPLVETNFALSSLAMET